MKSIYNKHPFILISHMKCKQTFSHFQIVIEAYNNNVKRKLNQMKFFSCNFFRSNNIRVNA